MRQFIQYIKKRIIASIGCITWINNKYCNVIYFHDIVSGEGYSYMHTNKDKYIAFMNVLLREGFETLRFDDLNDPVKLKSKRKRVLIAFDDGWISNYTEIFCFMKSHNLKYNIFLTIGEIDNNHDYLSWKQINEMYSSGIVGFGVHTYTHPDMSDISKINPSLEFDKANSVFSEKLGFYPTDFCYPFGFYSEESNHYIIRIKVQFVTSTLQIGPYRYIVIGSTTLNQ